MNPEFDRQELEIQRLEAQFPPPSHLDQLLATIPQDTPYTVLSTRLSPLLEALSKADEITAALFIDKTVKEYFGLNLTDLKPFHRSYLRLKKMNQVKTDIVKKKSDQTVLLDRDINSSEVIDAISKIGIVDPGVLELVIAAFVAAKLGVTPPIWIMLIGVPSSCKTELVRLIDLPSIYSLDSLSEHAFISGYILPDGSSPEDLLPQLDGKCFVIKDLTTIFSLKEDTVKKILGDLTSIFDGKFERFIGTRGDVRYTSMFSMIACITPAILSKHHRYIHQLGGRFFFVRIPELTSQTRAQGYKIAWDQTSRSMRIKQARQIVSTYCHQLSEKAVSLYPTLEIESDEVQAWINTATEFVCHARGTTETKLVSFENDEGKKIDYYEVSNPQIEDPWRVLSQLQSLARVLTIMRGKTSVTIDELLPLKAIVLSSMPIDRALVVAALIERDKLFTREVADSINKSPKTALRYLKELDSLGLVIIEEMKDPSTMKDAKVYSLKTEYKQLLSNVQNPDCPF